MANPNRSRRPRREDTSAAFFPLSPETEEMLRHRRNAMRERTAHAHTLPKPTLPPLRQACEAFLEHPDFLDMLARLKQAEPLRAHEFRKLQRTAYALEVHRRTLVRRFKPASE